MHKLYEQLANTRRTARRRATKLGHNLGKFTRLNDYVNAKYSGTFAVCRNANCLLFVFVYTDGVVTNILPEIAQHERDSK